MSVKKFLKTAQEIQAKGQSRVEENKPPVAHDEGNWLMSYADMMTLLCGFFILLFSMAKIDEPQFEKVKESVSKQFGGDYKSQSSDMAKFVTQVVQEAGIDQQTNIKTDASGVSVIFQSTLFFETLSADVKPEGKQVLEKMITSLAERQEKEGKHYRIVVEGHTDSRPILAGPYPSNWELSGARASRVIRIFLDHHFTPERLTAIGYADTYPEVAGRNANGSYDEGALGKNRRVVLRIIDPKVDALPFPDAPGRQELDREPANQVPANTVY